MSDFHLEINGVSFGEVALGPRRIGGAMCKPSTAVWLCPHCGNTWAKLAGTSGIYKNVHKLPCTTCGLGLLFHMYGPDQYIKNFPRDVILRELRLIAAEFETVEQYQRYTGNVYR